MFRSLFRFKYSKQICVWYARLNVDCFFVFLSPILISLCLVLLYYISLNFSFLTTEIENWQVRPVLRSWWWYSYCRHGKLGGCRKPRKHTHIVPTIIGIPCIQTEPVAVRTDTVFVWFMCWINLYKCRIYTVTSAPAVTGSVAEIQITFATVADLGSFWFLRIYWL